MKYLGKKPKPASVRNKNAKRNRLDRKRKKRIKHSPRDGHTNETFKVVVEQVEPKRTPDPAWAPFHRKKNLSAMLRRDRKLKRDIRRLVSRLDHSSDRIEVPSGAPTEVHNAMRRKRYTGKLAHGSMPKATERRNINVRQALIAARNGWSSYEAVSDNRRRSRNTRRVRFRRVHPSGESQEHA